MIYRSILLVEEIQTHKLQVIKLFKKETSPKAIENEAQLLLSLSHPRVIECLGYYPRVLIPLPVDVNAPDFNFPCDCYSALALEYAPNGDLLQLVTSLGYLPEEIARACFQQIVDAVEYLHNDEICRLDLKPDNILIDENFSLRLCDFGTALRSHVDSLVKGTAGTVQYFSPEMLEESNYNGFQADVFGLGVVLFTMVSGILPFAAAKPSDAIYGLIVEGKYVDFWKIHEGLKGQSQHFYSADFRDLIQGMLEVKPEKRLSIKEIKAHQWLKESTVGEKELSLYIRTVLEKQMAMNSQL